METINEVTITGNNMFFIPDFQRSFVWGKEEIAQLFDDFAEDTNSFTIETGELEGYLLGNIVLIEQEDGPAMVIDGQQRLTTITLIFRALMNIVNTKASKASSNADRTKWVKKIGDLMKGYSILNDDDEVQALRLVHDASLKFGSYYNKLLIDPEDVDDTANEINENDIETPEDANIHEVYTYAYEYIQGLDNNQLNKFINYFRNKVKLIVTSAPTEAKAFQLFEILNDRGRSLEPMDLIKNTFLKVLHQEGRPRNIIDQFIEDWQSTVANLNVDKKKNIFIFLLKTVYIILLWREHPSKESF